uniref:Calreticulin-3 n=1 Tax=Aotus nancymaae TaxID=37293 RepID=A0A2K5ECS5_AOTNA
MAGARVPLWAIGMLRVALATVYFQEEFLDGESPRGRWQNRWVQSTNDSRFGHFRVSSGKFYGHKEKDKGLQTTQNGRFYAISARFRPFSNKGKTLVIQYTVKHEQKMDCGGGYIKVFPADIDQKNLNEKSQYYIMFGPDICGFDVKKVHVILHFKNQYHENKKLIRCKVSGVVAHACSPSTLGGQGKWITLGQEFETSLNNLKKAPRRRGECLQCQLPGRVSDWNGELDGDWQAAMLHKPPCQDGLKPKGIDRDIWLHHKMKNTNYLTQYDLSEFEDIGAIGLELWQVRSGTIFDNFLITDDEEYADNFGKATWGETKGPEREMDAIQAKEEMKKAREEEEEELQSGQSNGHENYFNRFHKRNEL